LRKKFHDKLNKWMQQISCKSYLARLIVRRRIASS
jgi:hypothetical protein